MAEHNHSTTACQGMASVRISLFGDKTQNQPLLLELPYPELVALLMSHTELTSKGGLLWSAATYAVGSTRRNENVIAVSCAVADYDHNPDWEGITARLLPYEYIAHSTFQSTPESLRLRVVLPLSRPIPGPEYPSVRVCLDYHMFGLASDPAAKDASRMYFLPSCPPHALRFAEHHAGAWLDPYLLPPAPIVAGASVRSEVPQSTSYSPTVNLRPATAGLLDTPGPGHYRSPSEADSALAAALVRKGFTEDEVLNIIAASARGLDAIQRKGERYAESYWRRTVARAATFVGPVIVKSDGLRVRYGGRAATLRTSLVTEVGGCQL